MNKPFYLQQLEESGLSEEDVLAYAIPHGQHDYQWVPVIFRGSYDSQRGFNFEDDEMLIAYYDLLGKQETYVPKRSKTAQGYYRVRRTLPELNLNAKGKPMKYQTPAGAKSLFFYPQYIRDAFNENRHIKTLFIQEGEKKALKACKHGIPSIAIQGIGNIGDKVNGLIQGLQHLVQSCSIKNIVLLLDSDYNDLSKTIADGERADSRPISFSSAVIKFRKYILSMHNLGLDLEVFFGHIKENPNHDKVFDDLLVNTLNGQEHLLKEDLDYALNAHDGKGEFVCIYPITSASEYKIKDYWELNNHERFFELHKERLENIDSFKIGLTLYSVKDGILTKVSNFKGDRDLWYFEDKKDGTQKVIFDHVETNKFLIENGFFRIRTIDCDKDSWKLVRIEDNIIREVGSQLAREFVFTYAQQVCKSKMVHQMLIANLGKYLSDSQLERLPLKSDDFHDYQPNEQIFVFANGMLTITDKQISFGALTKSIWQNNIINRNFTRVPIFLSFEKDEDDYEISITEEGLKCEFLQFVINTSNFWDRDYKNLTVEETVILKKHLVNKITSIGYLLCDFKYQSELKAVIAMDGEMGDIAQSNGRTGKSLIGRAISFFIEQVLIDGRNTTNDDPFIFSNVTPSTRNIHIDDVNVNFDFERYFVAITGDLAVNPKGYARFVIENARSPKFYITTNHAINANSKSAEERINYMEFSNWYNDTNRPVDEFGHMLFADWDDEQWNLFDNFMAECVLCYFKSMYEVWYRKGQGAVQPPMEHIRLRQYKQRMGEAFYQWAENYFDPTGVHLNHSIKRVEMQKDFFDNCKDNYTTSTNFKRKLVEYCNFKHYHLNPDQKHNKTKEYFSDWINHHPEESFEGEAHKSNSIEYFFVTDNKYPLTAF